MKLPVWLSNFFSLDFPQPKGHNLPIQELLKFWEKTLSPKWRAQCELLVYRMDPAKAPFPSLAKLDGESYRRIFLDEALRKITPSQEWFNENPSIIDCVFCVRIQRTWKTQTGKRTKEICIATFNTGLNR